MNKHFEFRNLKLIFGSETNEIYRIYTRIDESENMVTVHTVLENICGRDIRLNEIKLFDTLKIFGSYDKTYSECRDLLGEVGINPADQPRVSYGILGYTDELGTKALLFGFDDFKDYFYKFVSEPFEGGFSVSVFCDLQGAYLAPAQKVILSDLKIYFSDSLSALLKVHSQNILLKMPVLTIENALGTGWCSWYYYYGTENKEDIFENMREMKSAALHGDGGFILIDDGWNQQRSNECVWGDWEAGYKFPEGMKPVCDRIHKDGFQAGIWLAPFAVSRNSSLFIQHPDWILGGKEDILNPNEGVFGLDLSNPLVLEYLRTVFTRVFDEWGFDIVKIDFLLYGAGEGNRYDKYCSGVQAFRKGLLLIRECAGNKIVINCGSPVLQSVGLCDVMRIGSDVGSRWHFPLNEGGWPYGNCSIKCSTRYTVYRNWMNYAFWINDPDCIVVREKSNGIEQEQFCRFFPYMQIDDKDFGLSENEANLWVKMIAFTGGLKYLSEKWSELTENRKELIRRYIKKPYPPCDLMDYYRYHDLYILKSHNKNSIAVFNVSDENIQLKLPADKIQNADRLKEVDSNLTIVRNGDMWEFPVIASRSGYIFEEQII